MEIIDPQSKKESIRWKRVRLDPALRQALHNKSDGLAFLQAGGHLALLVASGALAYVSYLNWGGWLTVALVFLHGTFANFLLNGFHELVHGTVFRSKQMNRIFLNLYSFLSWQNPVFFWASHTEHHKYTLHPPKDLEVALPVKITLRGFLQTGFIGYSEFVWKLPFFTRHALGRTKGVWEETLFPKDDAEKLAKLKRWARIVIFGHILIIGICLLFGNWFLPLIISLPTFYGGWLMFLCNNTQHVGLSDRVADFRLCCRTIRLNPILEFLYWSMNYHIEHHMYAAVPCYRLKALHKAIAHELPEPTRGLIATWREIVGILKRQKTEPGYQYRPRVPGDSERA